MMLKTLDHAVLNPVSRVSPVLSLLQIGHPAEAITDSNQFAHQQAQAALLNIQKLPELTQETTLTQVSAAAHLIDDILKQAEAKGLPASIQAQSVVTKEPAKPETIARDLKAAIQNTGLFYESHLSQYIEGHRSLTSILQEPQNQPGVNPNTLLPQQLNVLERQQIAWQGEIWPQQQMLWNLQVADTPSRDTQSQTAEPARLVTSDITLNLPNLGKVTAKLSVLDGRVQIKMYATEHETMRMMQLHAKQLADSIQHQGTMLDGLTVMREMAGQNE